jgi:hypothetical protein
MDRLAVGGLAVELGVEPQGLDPKIVGVLWDWRPKE